eukprot:scaffold28843_cov135-Isochrysis_galbana.AAC.1
MGAPGGGARWVVRTSVQPAHEGSSLGRVLLAAGAPGESWAEALAEAERAVLAEWEGLVADVVAGRQGPVQGHRLTHPMVVRLGAAEFELFECSRTGE